jgi:hypothetical protein
VEHATVYAAPGIYAGWPANHGAWQKGDELLVGFVRGRHIARGEPGDGDHHSVDCNSLQKVQARSLDGASDDGGQTWRSPHTLRRGTTSDIGYPRLFRRADGRLVCIYYWSDSPDAPKRIEAAIFDPKEF